MKALLKRIYRSAISGKFVGKKDAQASPETTVSETLWRQVAFTEATGESYPSYINVRPSYEKADSFIIFVRERGYGGERHAFIQIPRADLSKFAANLSAMLGQEAK